MCYRIRLSDGRLGTVDHTYDDDARRMWADMDDGTSVTLKAHQDNWRWLHEVETSR